MSKPISHLLMAALALAISGPAAAAVIDYDEAVGGDLSDDGEQRFDLGVGVNSFTGRMRIGIFRGIDQPDFDSFFFTVPTGGRVTGISLDLNEIPGGTGRIDDLLFELRTASDDRYGAQIQVPIERTSLFQALMPLDAGSYLFRQAGGGGWWDPGQFNNVAYKVDMTVAPVPLPGAAPLLLAGLAAFGALRLRRRGVTSR